MSSTTDLLFSLSSTTASSLTSSLTGSTSSSTSASATSALDYNFNEFLTLFTTQLENQDPTNPMDTSQMTNQLALFSEVEQQASTNSILDKILSAVSGSSLTSATGYIGHTVEASGDQVALSDGSATISYSLPSTAASVSVEVLDSSGAEVTTLSGGTSTGTNGVTWDGTDSSGGTVSDGTYTFEVMAKDSSGNTITATTYTTGKVSGVSTNDSEMMLDLGTIQVKASDVVAVMS